MYLYTDGSEVLLHDCELSGNTAANYGGAVYGSNGVPDVSADGMIARCKDVTTDFTRITPGEALWLPGHIGLYIGSGLCVECTPAFEDGVQVTFVWNLGGEKPYPGRVWQKHGKLHWVDYAGESAETWFDGKKQGENGTIIVNGTEPHDYFPYSLVDHYHITSGGIVKK